jgi:DNA-binding GntR family transcriptional regulator
VTFLSDLGDRTSLRETIAEALRSAIITGEMRPGELYSAPTLAQRLGVSATPVREAMLALAQEGMVEAVRNKGFRVVELDDTDLDQINYIRRLVEVPAVKEITSGPRHAEAEALRDAAQAIVKAAQGGDLIEYARADTAFHLDVLRLSGNDVLVHLVGDLRSRSRLYGLRSLVDSGRLADSASEHERLVDLIVGGDAEAARDLMDAHIQHVRGIWAGRPETG